MVKIRPEIQDHALRKGFGDLPLEQFDLDGKNGVTRKELDRVIEEIDVSGPNADRLDGRHRGDWQIDDRERESIRKALKEAPETFRQRVRGNHQQRLQNTRAELKALARDVRNEKLSELRASADVLRDANDRFLTLAEGAPCEAVANATLAANATWAVTALMNPAAGTAVALASVLASEGFSRGFSDGLDISEMRALFEHRLSEAVAQIENDVERDYQSRLSQVEAGDTLPPLDALHDQISNPPLNASARATLEALQKKGVAKASAGALDANHLVIELLAQFAEEQDMALAGRGTEAEPYYVLSVPGTSRRKAEHVAAELNALVGVDPQKYQRPIRTSRFAERSEELAIQREQAHPPTIPAQTDVFRVVPF